MGLYLMSLRSLVASQPGGADTGTGRLLEQTGQQQANLGPIG